MRKIEIIELNTTTKIKSGDTVYILCPDKKTGDWSVHSAGDKLVQGDWMLTKDDAIKYALERAGVVEDANYQRAPDRTSA